MIVQFQIAYLSQMKMGPESEELNLKDKKCNRWLKGNYHNKTDSKFRRNKWKSKVSLILTRDMKSQLSQWS